MLATNNGEYNGRALKGKFLKGIKESTGTQAWKILSFP